MKPILFSLLLLPCFIQAQLITKNELKVMSCEFFAGYAQSWRDEVNYHPNQLFRNFPNLKGAFWDIRIQDKPGFLNTEWDGDHVLKGIAVFSHITAVVIKIGNGKPKFKEVLKSLVLNYSAYKLGFVTGWCLVHRNRL